MQLNKTGANTGRTNDLQTKNVPVKNNAQTQVASQLKTINIKPEHSLTSLIKALGLPQDKLSSSILSFARFFSLAFKPEKLADIRRQVMNAPVQQNAAQNEPRQLRPHSESIESLQRNYNHAKEVLSLAASAAESKGAELQPKGLELYSRAVDPDQHKEQDNDKHEKERQKKEQNEKEKTGEINAGSVKKTALESAENIPVLQIMNKLPGKNGQRWIVLPFEFSKDGKNFRVSMRVLLEKENVRFMALDIFQGAGSNVSRHSLAFKFANNKVCRLNYYNQHMINKKAQSAALKELASLFKIPIENVNIKTDEILPEAEYGEELLRFIDEAV